MDKGKESTLIRLFKRRLAKVVKDAHENRGDAVEKLMVKETAYEMVKEVTIRTI